MSNIKISDLTPDDKNYNKGSEFGNSLIEKSLRKFGAGRSILIDKNNRIIAGNKTIENAGAIGLEDIIVVETTGNQIVAVKRTDIDLDSKQGRELALADNASAKANITWNEELISEDWTQQEALDWGVDTKFEVEAEEDDFAVPEGGVETDIVLGDLFEIGEHRLLCGDSTDSDQVAKLMNGQKADMVFTDPPYGMNLDADFSKMGSDTIKAGRKHENIENDDKQFDPSIIFTFFNYCDDIILFGADYYSDYIPNKNEGSWLIWDKRVEDKYDKIIGSAFETIFSKRKVKREIIRYEYVSWANRMADKVNGIKPHPTMKPIGMLNILLDKFKGNFIVDLFLGSGSTMAASHQLKRKCYGIELDPKYCQVIVDRMKKLDPSLIIKKNGLPL